MIDIPIPHGGSCPQCRRPIRYRERTTFSKTLEPVANADPSGSSLESAFRRLLFWEPDYTTPGHYQCSRAAYAQRIEQLSQAFSPIPPPEMTDAEFWERCTQARLARSEVQWRTFENYRPQTPLQREGFSALSGWKPGARAALLMGPPGVGKSHLMTALAVTLIRERLRVRYWNASALLAEMRSLIASPHPEQKAQLREIEGEFSQADVYFLDDFGVGHTSEWAMEIWFRLLDERMRADKPIFVSTNLEHDDWARIVDARLQSRFAGACELRFIDGPDKRMI